MNMAVAVAIAASLLFAAFGPRLARRLPPATATRILTVGCVLTAGYSTFVLAVAAFTWIGQLPQVAEQGKWSPQVLRADDPVPTLLAQAATIVLLPVAAWLATVTGRRAQAVIAVHRACRRLAVHAGLTIVEADAPSAFTTPELTGRTIVTTGLLRRLTLAECQVVLAHEASHRCHRHPWWIIAADLAAAANPLLRPTTRAVAHAAERWADEDAAASLADRRLVACAIARAALLAVRRQPTSALAATGADVPHRVRALLGPRPRSRPVAVAGVITLLLTATVATAVVQLRGESLFERASITQVSTGSVRPAGDVYPRMRNSPAATVRSGRRQSHGWARP